jgi:ketosteroid isomerase-like protein
MYPTISEIRDLFANLSNGQASVFFDRVIDDVDWLIRGHSPMSGQYNSKVDFQAKTLKVLDSQLLKEPLAMYVDNVVGGGEQDQAVVEMHADSVCRNGECVLQ